MPLWMPPAGVRSGRGGGLVRGGVVVGDVGGGAGAGMHMETAIAGRTHPVSQGVARTRNDGETVVPPLSAPGTVPASTFRQPAPIRRRTPSGTSTSNLGPFWLPEPVRLAPSS